MSQKSGWLKRVPPGERPRERCLASQGKGLSLQELLAILLSPGTRSQGCWELAQTLVADADFMRLLAVGEVGARLQALGVAPAARARVLAACEIALRHARLDSHVRTVGWRKANLPRCATAALRRIPESRRTEAHEWMGLVPLAPGNRAAELSIVAEGGARAVATDARALMRRVLILDPPAFILVHNHPSGDCQPSRDDRVLTREVASLARRVAIPCLGHWIVSQDGEYWLAA